MRSGSGLGEFKGCGEGPGASPEKLTGEWLGLRKALSEEGSSKGGLWKGKKEERLHCLISAAFLPKCHGDPERSTGQRERMQRKADRGRREGKTTGKGKLWKLVTDKMKRELADQESSRNAREMGPIFYVAKTQQE